MKKSVVIAASVFAATAALVYVIKKKRTSNKSSNGDHPSVQPRTHHRTTIFANAKEKLMNEATGLTN